MAGPKETIKTLLEDVGQGVIVYDDGTPPVALTGHFLDHWPGKNDFGSHNWCITVGPVVGADAQIGSLGSFNKLIWEYIQVDIWVMEKRDSTYAAEKTRTDLVQEVDRCIHHFATSPTLGYKHINVSGWREIDETGMKRSSLTVEVLYEKDRT